MKKYTEKSKTVVTSRITPNTPNDRSVIPTYPLTTRFIALTPSALLRCQAPAHAPSHISGEDLAADLDVLEHAYKSMHPGLLRYNSEAQIAAAFGHFGLIYSRPAPAEAFSQDPRRPIPVMLKVEMLDAAMPAELARKELTEAMGFLAGVDLQAMTRGYRQ